MQYSGGSQVLILCECQKDKTQGGKYLSSEYNNEIRNELIELLRNELPVLRTKAMVSQEEIASKIGVSRQTFSSIETGKREMSWTVFLALIAFFQNNDNTRQMLNNLEGLSDGLEKQLSSDFKKNEKNHMS